MMNPEPKPCPMCESTDIHLLESYTCGDSMTAYRMRCETCGAIGPVVMVSGFAHRDPETTRSAINLWNDLPRKSDVRELVKALNECFEKQTWPGSNSYPDGTLAWYQSTIDGWDADTVIDEAAQ